MFESTAVIESVEQTVNGDELAESTLAFEDHEVSVMPIRADLDC
jgi:hypothetical protein